MAKRPNGKLCRSVGAIITNSRGYYLVLYRKKIPCGLGLPAGHIEVGESAIGALKREIYEETGLIVKRTKRKLYAKIPGKCDRG
ncbi:MAG: NUDIX hydrolase, partial [Patescibacteria group bacterium]